MSNINCYEITYEFKVSFCRTEESMYSLDFNWTNTDGKIVKGIEENEKIPLSDELISKIENQINNRIIKYRTYTRYVPYTDIRISTMINSNVYIPETGNEIASKTFNTLIHIKSQKYTYNKITKSIEAKLICLIDETYNNLTTDNVEDILCDNMNELYYEKCSIGFPCIKYMSKKWDVYMIVDEVPTNIQIKNI